MAEMRNLRTQRADILTEITDLTGARAGRRALAPKHHHTLCQHFFRMFNTIFKFNWIFISFACVSEATDLFQGCAFPCQRQDKNKEGSDQYAEEQVQRSTVKEERAHGLGPESHAMPSPKHAHLERQEGKRRGVKILQPGILRGNVRLIRSDFTPRRDKRQRRGKERKRSVGRCAWSQILCPGPAPDKHLHGHRAPCLDSLKTARPHIL